MNLEKIISEIELIKIIEKDEKKQSILIKNYIDNFNENYVIKNKNYEDINKIENQKEDFIIRKIPRNEYEKGVYKNCNSCVYYKSYESYTLAGMFYCEKEKDFNRFLLQSKTFTIYDSPYKLVNIYECKYYKDSFDIQIEKSQKLINEIDEMLKIEIILDEDN